MGTAELQGVVAMALTAKIASDPPGSRRFRMMVPVAVLIVLLAMILAPGLARHVEIPGVDQRTVEVTRSDAAPPEAGGAPSAGG